MTRDYLPFNFPGDKSYVSELLNSAAELRDDLTEQISANWYADEDTLCGLNEKFEAAQEIVDTLVLWLNS